MFCYAHGSSRNNFRRNKSQSQLRVFANARADDNAPPSDRLSKQYNQDFSQLIGKYAIAGNPDDCIARIQEYIDAGATTIFFNSACPQHHVIENERLLAAEVLSAFPR